jgi:hypothetical protein
MSKKKPDRPEQQLSQRNQDCRIRIERLSTLSDKELNQIIEKNKGLF